MASTAECQKKYSDLFVFGITPGQVNTCLSLSTFIPLIIDHNCCLCPLMYSIKRYRVHKMSMKQKELQWLTAAKTLILITTTFSLTDLFPHLFINNQQ